MVNMPQKGKTTRVRIPKVMTPLRLQSGLLRFNAISIFSKRDVCRLLKLTERQAARAIEEAVNEGVLVRIKRGLFFLAVRQPGALTIANYLLEPSYISLETALSYYRVIPETVYSVTSITPKAPRTFTRLNRKFTYHHINRMLYFGYGKAVIGGTKILIADKEKAVLDYLYFVVQGHRKLNPRSNLAALDQTRLNAYIDTFKTSLGGRKIAAFENLLSSLYLI
jgi:predicted transcriptional regulator of viral defense system